MTQTKMCVRFGICLIILQTNWPIIGKRCKTTHAILHNAMVCFCFVKFCKTISNFLINVLSFYPVYITQI